MAEMSKIEEVARALCVQMGEDPDQKTKYHPKRNFVWEHYIAAARAAIEAMNEPNDAMVDAAAGEFVPPGDFIPGYRAAIRAALSEEVAG